MNKISFNIPPYIGEEDKYIQQVIANHKICGDGEFTKKCNTKLEEITGTKKAWINGLTAFSVKPLRISSLIGVICAIAGFVFGIVTVIRKLFIPNINVGWSSTIAIMLFMGGLIMLMLGMIGEYIGRIYISLNNAPQYVVRNTVNIDDNNE